MEGLRMKKQLDRHEQMLFDLPIIADWVMYKNENMVIMPNYEETVKHNKPMVDVSYCMTRALNNSVLETVEFTRNDFSPSRLSNVKWKD